MKRGAVKISENIQVEGETMQTDNGITARWDRNDIQVFRGVAILLVLIHHAMSASKTQSAGLIFDFVFRHVSNVHVVIFFVIAGYLFEKNITKYMSDQKRFLFDKAKRLLIPYLVWSVIIAVIVNVGLRIGVTASIFQKLGFEKWTIADFFRNTVFFTNSYLEVLWFLYCLFVIFVVNVLFPKQCASVKWLTILMMVIAAIQTMAVSPYMIRKVFLHIFNFSAGRIIYRKNLENKLQTNQALIVAFAVILFYNLKYYLGISFAFLPIYLQKVYQMIHAFSESICLFIVIQQIWFRCVKKIPCQYVTNKLLYVGNYSFSIYLMHNPWIVAPVCKVLLMLGIPHVIIVLLAVVLACIIPYYLTRLIVKNQYLAAILLGIKIKKQHPVKGEGKWSEKNNLLWFWYKLQTYYRRLYRMVTGKKIVTYRYAGKIVLTEEKANDEMYHKLQLGTPFMACRYGLNELATLVNCEQHKDGNINLGIQLQMEECAGFFPVTNQTLLSFAELMRESSAYADYIGVMYSTMEDYAVAAYAPQCELMRRRTLEPWKVNLSAGRKPWTYGLEGKKVLVIHPFEESIKKQYARRETLFTNPEILPKFELKTLKAVQTIAGETDERFASWFDALQYMYDQAMCQDFDVALIGCGAYGMPLAAMLKKAGKTAIHIGGALQLLFGIKGGRWNTDPIVSKMFNEYWVSPSDDETPQNKNRVEKGCYW